MDPVKTCKVILVCDSLHYLCKQGNLNIPPFPDEDNINLGIDANPNLPDSRVQVGLGFRDEFADLDFQYISPVLHQQLILCADLHH